MGTTTRQRMIDAVRRALGRPDTDRAAAPPQPPDVDEALARLAGTGDDLADLFTKRAEEVGTSVRRCGADSAADTLLGLLEEIGAKRIAAAIDHLPEGPAITRAMRDKGVDLVEWRGDRTMDADYHADAGITGVAAALAETGTLVCESGPRNGRGLSLVPEVHIAIVRIADILPDMLDYMARIEGAEPRQLPASLSMITGPSKTADIEGVLITGVHGPGRVFVLLVG